ncbi:MAG: hypothetical protein OJF50_002447 [Nitrospira sp.]|jgi:hypothetical protein|nr:hypothetical protein [Nitrospira sp.]
MAFREFTGELDAPVSTQPTGKFREFTGELDPQPMTDREAFESHPVTRLVRGIEGPAITLMKMVGPDSIKQQLGEIDQLREAGMKKRGNEGFDWAGLVGSLVPGGAIAKGVTGALPAATSVLGKMGVGAATGAATAGAQPLPGNNELSTDKLKQMGVGAAVGGAIPAVVQGVKSFFGTNRLNPTQAATLKEGQAAGYTVPPSMQNPSGLNNTLESIAGKAAVKQDAATRNQKVTNMLVAKELGLPPGTMIDEDVLQGIRTKEGEAYQRMAALNPGGELRRLQVRSQIAQDMEPGPVTGLRVTKSQPMEPGPVTGLNVRTIEGTPPTTGLRTQEIRDAEGRLLGLKVGKNSEGIEGPLEGLKAKVTSRGQDVPGQLEGMKTTVVSRGQDVKGPLQGMKMSVSETRGGRPLEDLKELRSDANAYYKEHFRQGTVRSLKKAQDLTAKAKALEDDFEARAAQAGQPEIVNDMKKARQLIAKTYDVEKGLNIGDSNISAKKIGGKLDTVGVKGQSGNLLTIGKMANAFDPVMGDGSKIPVPGVSGTDALASAILSTMGYGAAGPAGLAAAAVPFVARPAARNLVLSPIYQKYLAQGIPARYAPLIDAMTQQAIGAGGTAVGRNY